MKTKMSKILLSALITMLILAILVGIALLCIFKLGLVLKILSWIGIALAIGGALFVVVGLISLMFLTVYEFIDNHWSAKEEG